MLSFISKLLNHEAFASLREYAGLLKERYNRLSGREQWLINLAIGLIGMWVFYDLVYQSFSERRAELIYAHQQAIEDYEWLNEQQERLSTLLVQRGVQREGLDDVEGTLEDHIKKAEVDYRPNNVIVVSWRGDSADQFLKGINSLISKGAALRSLEFSRPDRSRSASFKAELRL